MANASGIRRRRKTIGKPREFPALSIEELALVSVYRDEHRRSGAPLSFRRFSPESHRVLARTLDDLEAWTGEYLIGHVIVQEDGTLGEYLDRSESIRAAKAEGTLTKRVPGLIIHDSEIWFSLADLITEIFIELQTLGNEPNSTDARSKLLFNLDQQIKQVRYHRSQAEKRK